MVVIYSILYVFLLIRSYTIGQLYIHWGQMQQWANVFMSFVGNVSVNGSIFALSDVPGTNGVAHFTTKVFMPLDWSIQKGSFFINIISKPV